MRLFILSGSAALCAAIGTLSGCGSDATCDELQTCGHDDAGSTADAATHDASAADVSADHVAPKPDGAVDGGAVDSAVDGGVTCDSGTAIVCNGQCVEPSDPAHCGSCSNVCPSGTPL